MTSWRAMWAVIVVLLVAVGTTRLVDDPAEGTLTWDASRGAGFVAYALLWAGLISGTSLHLRYRFVVSLGWLLEFHRATSVLGLALTIGHVAALLVDTGRFRVVDGFVPFVTAYRPFQVGLGTVSLWLVVAVLASTALTPSIARATWKRLHLLSYPAYALALAHGLTAGTDASALPVVVLYAVTAGGAAAVVAARIPGRGWADAIDR